MFNLRTVLFEQSFFFESNYYDFTEFSILLRLFMCKSIPLKNQFNFEDIKKRSFTDYSLS